MMIVKRRRMTRTMRISTWKMRARRMIIIVIATMAPLPKRLLPVQREVP